MQIIVVGHMGVILQKLVDLALGVFRVGQLRRDVNMPVREPLIQRGNPFRDSGLAGVDLLAAADQADDCRPVLPLITRPDQEGCFGHREIRHLQLVAVGSAAFEIVRKPLVRP